MQEIGTMQVSGPMSSNSSDPKGSIFNPYTVDEFEYMFDHGLWTVGAYVQTMGYVMPTLYVQGNNNSNPPCGYVNWCYYSTMDLYGYISTFTNGNIASYGGYVADAFVALYEGDLREVSGNVGAAAGAFSCYYLGIALGGGVGSILLVPTAPARVVAGAVGGVLLSIFGADVGRDIGYAVHDIYEEYFNIIFDNE